MIPVTINLAYSTIIVKNILTGSDRKTLDYQQITFNVESYEWVLKILNSFYYAHKKQDSDKVNLFNSIAEYHSVTPENKTIESPTDSIPVSRGVCLTVGTSVNNNSFDLTVSQEDGNPEALVRRWSNFLDVGAVLSFDELRDSLEKMGFKI